jgi:hypothetical protein
MFKKKYFIALFLISTFSILHSQPYYYTSTYEPIPGLARHSGDLYRINMSNPAVVESLMTNVYELTSTYSDEYGNWLAYEDNRRLFIMNLNNPTQNNIIENHSEGIYKFSYAEEVNRLIVLYEANPEKLVLVNPATLTITDTIPYDIHWEIFTDKDMSLSKIGDIMYLLKTDTVQQKGYIASYSLLSKQIIAAQYISEISESGADEFYFNYRRNGLSVIESLFLLPTPASYYRIYFLDKDSLSIPIIRDDSQTWADGYVASEGDYLLLFNNLLNPDSVGFTYTGKIEIYDMTNGDLEKTIQLPPGGEVMCFENYPNNIYYAIDIEEPTRQIYTLKMDSIFNVLDLTTLNPSSEIVNSPPFTLTVYGHGFDSLSTVYFNATAKTTTFISDSVLTAEISTSDISVVGNYSFWVTDEWGTSDTLLFSVLHEPPILNAISPAIVLKYISGGSLPSGLTVTATGYNFSDSSVAYFNGNAKTTRVVSDTVLTFPITGSEMSTLGNSAVWISAYGTNSDTLTFSVTDNLPQSLTPTLQCVRNMGDGSYWAYFGYNNNNSVSVYVPLGSKNKFAPTPIDRGQPKLFLPGDHTNVFIVVFSGKNLIWTLDQASVTANKDSTPCP